MWFWENLILASIQSVFRWFTGIVRRNALWVMLAGIFLVLIATEQYQILDLLLTYSLVIGLIIFGFSIMFRGFKKKKKK
ncbi:TPA: hypothetical protein DEP58_05505 [Patescibacteria group bacterium]|nr:hypothetical protein [Patescibacteria group bacterium]